MQLHLELSNQSGLELGFRIRRLGLGLGGLGVRVPRHRRRACAVHTQYFVGRDGALVKANVSCSDSDSYSSSPRACDGESSEAVTD